MFGNMKMAESHRFPADSQSFFVVVFVRKSKADTRNRQQVSFRSIFSFWNVYLGLFVLTMRFRSNPIFVLMMANQIKPNSKNKKKKALNSSDHFP
jgi:hypothetical protein